MYSPTILVKDITFKEINMGVLRISGWGIDGMSNLQIEANIDGEWKTIYNANPNNATLDGAEVVTGKNDYFVSSDLSLQAVFALP